MTALPPSLPRAVCRRAGGGGSSGGAGVAVGHVGGAAPGGTGSSTGGSWCAMLGLHLPRPWRNRFLDPMGGAAAGGRGRIMGREREEPIMCLQWCYVRTMVIDNDVPCWECPAYGGPPPGPCATCTHRHPGAHGDVCGLTRMPLPTAGGCCHYNAIVTEAPEAVPLDAVAVAPWLLAGNPAAPPAAFLADHPSAPALEWRDGRAWLRLDELAVPVVYGVTADAWDDAVPAPLPAPPDPPHAAVALEVLETLVAGGEVAPAAARLEALLAAQPLEDLPEAWRGIIAATLELIDGGHRS